MSRLSKSEAEIAENAYHTLASATKRRTLAVVLSKIILTILFVSHASWACCQEIPAQLETMPQPLAVYENPADSPTASYVYLENTPAPQPSYSAPLDTVIADEEERIISSIPNYLVPSSLVTSGLFFEVDYFTRAQSADYGGNITETGPLFSLGYHAYKPKYKYRIALFGGDLNYNDPDLAAAGMEVSSSPHSEYFGVSFEYDFRWSLPSRPNTALFVGFGTRWWQRKTNVSVYITESVIMDMSLKDNWFTFYPRIGLDSFRQLDNGWQLYTSASIGLTAYTSQHVDQMEAKVNLANNISLNLHENPDLNLRPKSDIYTQAEISLKKNHLFLSFRLELLTWETSDPDKGYVQDAASLLTTGFLAGCHF